MWQKLKRVVETNLRVTEKRETDKRMAKNCLRLALVMIVGLALRAGYLAVKLEKIQEQQALENEAMASEEVAECTDESSVCKIN